MHAVRRAIIMLVLSRSCLAGFGSYPRRIGPLARRIRHSLGRRSRPRRINPFMRHRWRPLALGRTSGQWAFRTGGIRPRCHLISRGPLGRGCRSCATSRGPFVPGRGSRFGHHRSCPCICRRPRMIHRLALGRGRGPLGRCCPPGRGPHGGFSLAPGRGPHAIMHACFSLAPGRGGPPGRGAYGDTSRLCSPISHGNTTCSAPAVSSANTSCGGVSARPRLANSVAYTSDSGSSALPATSLNVLPVS